MHARQISSQKEACPWQLRLVVKITTKTRIESIYKDIKVLVGNMKSSDDLGLDEHHFCRVTPQLTILARTQTKAWVRCQTAVLMKIATHRHIKEHECSMTEGGLM